ncbi:MAG: serine/threonine-protein kinase [Sandaracinaceae bacterium]
MTHGALSDFGPYSILRPIAKGGMAELYLARQRGLEGVERTVVIKRILERYAHDDEFITMFLDEARLLAALSHPNIAQVFEIGRVEDSFYLAMEYVRGPTLGRLINAARERGATLPRREGLGVGLAIAEALKYVHSRRDEVGRPLNIVHRDLNPANVLVSYDGAVKLIDFGIAKAATKVYETRTGVIKGTYGYIAPEQLVGDTPVDRRADVFALGILLYEIVVGQHPYDVSDEPNLIDRILEARYRRPRDIRGDVPRDLDELIARCLSPLPEGRPQDLAEVIDALSRHLGEQGLVPTMSGLASLAVSTVPDEEGPRPLRPLTQQHYRRPFAADPTGTRRVPLEASSPEHATRVSRPPPSPDGWGPGQRLANALLTDDPPLTYDNDTSDLRGAMAGREIPTEALLRISGSEDDEPMTIARAFDAARPTDEESSVADEAPTRLVSLSDALLRAPREHTPTPLVRSDPNPAPKRATPFAWIALGGLLVLVAVGGGAIYAIRLLGTSGGDATPQAVVDDPTTASAAPSAVSRLSIVSDPAGARVRVDGREVQGRTPLTVDLPENTQEVWLSVSLDGYAVAERRVLATIGEARFVLSRLAAPPPPPGTTVEIAPIVADGPVEEPDAPPDPAEGSTPDPTE